MENQEERAIAEAVRALDRVQERNAMRTEVGKIASVMAAVTKDARFEALTALRAMNEIMVHGKREMEKMAEEGYTRCYESPRWQFRTGNGGRTSLC
jgi:hypothetical protein